MKQSWWKIGKSYFSDQLIEETGSEYNEELYLLLVRGRYQLVTDKVIYSYADKYDNFYEVFKKIDLKGINNCLLLGFGLGSIPYMIEHNFKKRIAYTGIEIDEEIIYLASTYVLDELKSPIDLIHADAGNFMDQNTEQYDMICIDLFINDEIPSQFQEVEFLEKCKESMTTKGQLIYNCLYLTNKDRKYSNKFFNEVFLHVFPQSKAHHCGNNLMLVAY